MSHPDTTLLLQQLRYHRTLLTTTCPTHLVQPRQPLLDLWVWKRPPQVGHPRSVLLKPWLLREHTQAGHPCPVLLNLWFLRDHTQASQLANTLDQLLTPHHRCQGRSCPERWLGCCLTMTQATVIPHCCADGAISAMKTSERVH